jgi:hypothetical protein
MDLARAPRRAPLTARKKGSGYENGNVQRYRIYTNKDCDTNIFPYNTIYINQTLPANAEAALFCLVIH